MLLKLPCTFVCMTENKLILIPNKASELLENLAKFYAKVQQRLAKFYAKVQQRRNVVELLHKMF